MAESETGLFISPRLCLLAKNENHCHIQLKVRWRAESPGTYCLSSSDKITPLQCWNMTKEAKVVINMDVREETKVQLIAKASGNVIYEETIMLQRQVTQYRKKRRNPWQFY